MKVFLLYHPWNYCWICSATIRVGGAFLLVPIGYIIGMPLKLMSTSLFVTIFISAIVTVLPLLIMDRLTYC